MSFKDFCMKQFDKILLFTVLMVFLIVALFIFRWFNTDNAMIMWASTLVSGAFAALMLLITGNTSKQTSNPNNENK